MIVNGLAGTSCSVPTSSGGGGFGLLRNAMSNRVLWALGAILFGVYLYSPMQAWESVHFTLAALWGIFPFLLLSVLLAAALMASGADQVTARVFSGNVVKAIMMAALFGALSPFCSCGVVPLIAGLLLAGVPLAPVMAFWLASPIMDPELFILTTAGISLSFAIAKTLIAVGVGLMAGYLTLFLQRRGAFSSPLRQGLASDGCGCKCEDGGSPQDGGSIVWKFWREKERVEKFQDVGLSNLWFLLRWMTLAFLLESLMVAFISPESVAARLGGDSVTSIVAAAIIGVPTYLNGYAAIPLIARLMEFGMLPGAAMSFVVAGSITSIPAAMAVYAIARKGVFAWYLLLAFAGAVGFSLFYQSILWMV